LSFTIVNADDSSPFTLVFSSGISVGDAVEQSYKLGSRDNFKDVALYLRGVILKAFNDSKDLQWPPPLNDLEVNEGIIPHTLQSFLNLVITGQPRAPSCNAERLIFSIGQDLCRAVTKGEWKLPKHILLCMTLHHLFRSKNLLTVLNRLGHCENYSFAMELETAIAVALDQTSSLLTRRIVKSPGNILFHSEWDNFNQILTGIHGKPAFNTSAGIMLQEATESEEVSVSANLPAIPRTKQRSLNMDSPIPLPPFHISKKKGPHMKLDIVRHPEENTSALQNGLNRYIIWVLCRTASSSGKQQVPALCGFISATGCPPKKLTTIDYYPSITEPITEYNVVKELLDKCEKATEEVGQLYTITTFDLGVVMKALPIIWQNPERYKNHIVLIGPFHTIMNYLNMLGHKMAGSGYSEIIIEANLVTSGSLKGVLSGKKYTKSIWCLKVVSEAVERLLLKAFVDQLDETASDSMNLDALDALIKDCSEENLLSTLQDDSLIQCLNAYFDFQDRVRNGDLGKTGQFWMSFLDHARRIFLLLYAVKVNDLQIFHKCMADMADLFFCFGGINYSRYLTWFDLFLTNIESTHPGATQLLERGAISVARSYIPGNLCSVDKTMEETYMKFAKSHSGSGGAGLTGILENYGAYQRWIRTTSERSKYYQATLEMCGMNNDSDVSSSSKHREQTKSEIKRSETAVRKAMDAIEGFINPFDVADKTHLYVLSSGAPVPADVEFDVLNAEKIGQKEKEKFVNERLSGKGKKDFFDKLQKPKLKTMANMNKKLKLTSTQGQVIQYQEQANIAFQILVKSQLLSTPISIDELMTFCLSPVPHSLGTPDGFMAKTNKATLLHYLTSDVSEASLPTSAAGTTIFIEDGNATFHSLKDIPPTFKHICLKVLNQLGHKPDLIFSTDMYVKNSIKSQERLRRGCSEKIILEGINTRKPADFKLFLGNDENKNQLFKLMHTIWTGKEAARCLPDRRVIIVVQGQAFLLTSPDGQTVDQVEIESLRSEQEETDTRVILYLLYAKQQGYRYAVVHSPDSDIFFILLYYVQKLEPLIIFFDTGSGQHRRLLNITEIGKDLGHEFCETLLGFYCFTGEDCNSCFKGKGKVNPMKKLEKKPKFQSFFSQLGDTWNIENLIDALEAFTCLMYGYVRVNNVNTVRSLMIKKMVGTGDIIKSKAKINFAKLPPCKDSLVRHIQRVNLRVGQWKHAHIPIPEIPPPIDHGWEISGDFLQPVWSQKEVLPSSLVNILAENQNQEESQNPEEDSSCDEISEDEDECEYSSDEDSS
jgi:hypothetical protein